MLAEVRTIESNFEILGVTEYIDLPEIEWMDLSSDGKMLLGQITPSQEKSEPLTLVINWEDLEKK